MDAKDDLSRKPIAVKVGNVTVKIYRVRTHGRVSFQVADYSSGRRKLRSFSDERQARDEATNIAIKLSKGEGIALELSGSDRAAYVRAVELLRPTGVAFELAAAQFADAHRKLGGRSLTDAIDFYLKRNPSILPRKTVTEVFEEFLGAKQADGASAIYIKDLRFRIGKFTEAFQGLVSDVDVPMINDWLRHVRCGPRGRNNYRLAICTLFKFAESAGYLADGHLDFQKIAKAREAHGEIEIFRPEEMRRLLEASRVDPDTAKTGTNRRYTTSSGLLPYLVLGAFAGLRTAEIERQRWEDINLERGYVRVTAAKGNTAQKRLVPVSANLREWLLRCRQPTGLVCSIARIPDAVRRLSARANVPWKHNGLRHSFISYRVAQTQNIPQVSLEAGNSPKMVHRHYREMVTPDEAVDWFNVRPAHGTKVHEDSSQECLST